MADCVCDLCGKPVTLLPSGWKPGARKYCDTHKLVYGRDPYDVVDLAIHEALHEQGTDTSTLLKWPWPSLHELAGFLLPGSVTYVAAFPGNGKTSFISRALYTWSLQGFRLYVMPTEARPKHLLTRLAAAAVGVDPDEAISLRLKEREEQGDPYAAADRARLNAEFHRIRKGMGEDGPPVAIEPTPRLTSARFSEACRAANAMGCDAIIVDHVDHIEGGDHESEYQASKRVQYDALDYAQRFNVPIVLMSQLNKKATGGDRLAEWRIPQTDWLWMKGVKDQVGATILGLHRVLDPDADMQQMGKVRSGVAEPHTVEIPRRMGIGGMKLRHNGAGKGRSVQLRYERGTLEELDGPDRREMQSSRDGVSTRPWWTEDAV